MSHAETKSTVAAVKHKKKRKENKEDVSNIVLYNTRAHQTTHTVIIRMELYTFITLLVQD
jgi:hypothetical protein